MASMQGMGDNLHQRAIVRQLMQQDVVYLDTPWPAIYHDLVGSRLQLVRPAAVTLRTQAKNAAREASKYHVDKPPRQVRMVRTWYTGADVRAAGSILGAMLRSAGCNSAGTDFRMPVPQSWLDTIDAYIRMWGPTKPILLYRPLVERTEWKGCAGRNPDLDSYVWLFDEWRKNFFVISVADLVPGKEWLVLPDYHPADVELHHGELTFEMLAALTKRAALVYCSPGFAPLLAQAVGTPNICVFGGHESSMTISEGAKLTPTLGIDPIVPCNCFDHQHTHKKEINIYKAHVAIENFLMELQDADTPFRRIGSALASHRLAQPAQAVHEPKRVGDADSVDRQREA
jgi:hypothetical protein